MFSSLFNNRRYISPPNDLRLLLNNDENTLSSDDRLTILANRINEAFLTSMASFLPLDSPLASCSPVEAVTFEDVSTENSVFLQLHLKSSKAPGPDGLPIWIFKENADALAKPVNDILNRERCLPASWKMADVTPLPKRKSVLDVNKHLRPISLSPILSKVAEEVVVERYIKPAIVTIVDRPQFGTVPNSSTTHSLISLNHQLSSSTDGNGSLVRMALLDFRNAFDLIDYHILVGKLQTLDLPCWVIALVTNFLTDRQQRVKLGGGSYSEWSSVHAVVLKAPS